MFETIISTQTLREHLDHPDWRLLDCRFELAYPERAEMEYHAAHIPRAVYAHLDRDLSSPIIPGITGRHPLPQVDALMAFFGDCGIGPGSQVVVYDALGGALAAARAWWLLHWLGLQSVAVLDGGWQKWVKDGLPVRGGSETAEPARFTGSPQPGMVVDSQQVQALIQSASFRLFDSRSADRFRGENETIDPVAGHIPGAVSAPYEKNINPDGTFLSPDALRERFTPLLGEFPVNQAVFYCGSGVTASHNILALEIAGLGQAQLYAGSWSEWITDPDRPVSR